MSLRSTFNWRSGRVDAVRMCPRTADAVTRQHATLLVASWLAELWRRQPLLAAVAMAFVLAMLPTGLAAHFDSRTINDISVWIKPTKFLFSIAMYYATIGWYFGYLPATAQRTRAGKFIIHGSIVVGVLEIVWLIAAAVAGVPAHFNRTSMLWAIAYPIAGVGATVMLVALLMQGILIGRDRTVALPAAFRSALVLGAWLAFVMTLLTAYTMAAGTGHWVGGARSDIGGLPLLGWSRTAGDLRVAHFWALHVHQLLPALVWLLADRWQLIRTKLGVSAIATIYVVFVLFTFVQALRGVPFI